MVAGFLREIEKELLCFDMAVIKGCSVSCEERPVCWDSR